MVTTGSLKVTKQEKHITDQPVVQRQISGGGSRVTSVWCATTVTLRLDRTLHVKRHRKLVVLVSIFNSRPTTLKGNTDARNCTLRFATSVNNLVSNGSHEGNMNYDNLKNSKKLCTLCKMFKEAKTGNGIAVTLD
jgi:alpha-D-ribose 1-methylphosphonate 5-triphosphate diphosphatase PhnM